MSRRGVARLVAIREELSTERSGTALLEVGEREQQQQRETRLGCAIEGACPRAATGGRYWGVHVFHVGSLK